MLVNRISGADDYANKKVSFQSRFFPNEALKDAICVARVDAERGCRSFRGINGRCFAKIMDGLLNDGKDDFIKVTIGPKGSTLIINGKRVNFQPELPQFSGFTDGKRVISNVIDYFTTKRDNNFLRMSTDEFKAMKPALDNLNAELNADDVTKNPDIYFHLRRNMNDIDSALTKYMVELLDKLEAKIFGKV